MTHASRSLSPFIAPLITVGGLLLVSLTLAQATAQKSDNPFADIARQSQSADNDTNAIDGTPGNHSAPSDSSHAKGAFSLPQAASPRVALDILPATKAFVPGATTEIGLRLNLPDAWYAYHAIILRSGFGLPTTFELAALDNKGNPIPGATFTPVRYPAPTYKESAVGDYLGYAFDPVFFTTLTLPENPATNDGSAMLDFIAISATASGLLCRDDGACIPFKHTSQYTFRVAADTEPANADDLDFAREQLAATPATAEYLDRIAVFTRHSAIPAGESTEAIFVINIADQHYIYDHEPGNPDFIPAQLWIGEAGQRIRAPDTAAQSWSDAKTASDPIIGTFRKQTGELIIRQPIEFDATNVEPGSYTFRYLFGYAPCEESGLCFGPRFVEGSFTLEVLPASASAVANPNAADLLERIDSGAVDFKSAKNTQVATAANAELTSLPWLLFLAFVGGIILNIMPCVLPVVALKVFGFVSQAGENRRRVFNLGLVYAAGILVSFLILATVITSLKLAWGGAMQSVTFNIILSGLVLALALSMLGVFEINLPGSAMNAGAAAASREGYPGAFLNGVLTTALATPCTAPGLGAGIGGLSQYSEPVLFLGIMTVGLGLATPYVLLCAVPDLVKLLPKPGAWMVTFKEVLGFVMLAVPLWLLNVIADQGGAPMVLGTLLFMLTVGIACWLIGRVKPNTPKPRAYGLWASAALVAALGFYNHSFFVPRSLIPWQPWEPGIGPRLAEQGYTVYIDYTATWCATCQTNKAYVLNTERIASEFDANSVYPIEADFTNLDPEMKAELEAHGRIGVPLNVIYPANAPDQPILLSEVLTQADVLQHLAQAGASTAPLSFSYLPDDASRLQPPSPAPLTAAAAGAP